MQWREKRPAKTIGEIFNNFSKQALESGSPFYVNLDAARNGEARNAPSNLIAQILKRCAYDNRSEVDEFLYRHLLFAGHRSSGKTTELHRIQEKLECCYHIIYIPDIEKQVDRISSQKDFLYYVISQLIAQCKNDPVFMGAVGNNIELLYDHLKTKIFGSVVEKRLLKIDHLIEAEASGGASVSILSSVISLMTKLNAKATFTEETQKELNLAIGNYFNEFMELANSILLAMQQASYRYKDQKLLLLVLDGLDKLDGAKAEKIFLDGSSFLTQLNVSMIVTFPICLLYSPRQNEATKSFYKLYILSMVKVHERNGSDCTKGIEALRSIVQARMDINALMEHPDDIDEAIRMSGGNIRELFDFITDAAAKADIDEVEKISTLYMQEVYDEAFSNTYRRIFRSYLPYLNQVFDDPNKDDVIRDSHENDTLLNIFDAGLLIEYNGKRWCDLHPLAKRYIAERRKNEEQNRAGGNDD